MIKDSVGAASVAMIVILGWSTAIQAQSSPTTSSNESTQSSTHDMAARVKQALHSEPALNDKHIVVSMENGKVVMKGFVNSAGDLTKALRAANKAAGESNVVNDLKIKTHETTQTDTTGL